MKELKIAENVVLRETEEGIEFYSTLGVPVDGFYFDEDQTRQIQMCLNEFLSRR